MVPSPRGSLTNLVAKRVSLEHAKDTLASDHALFSMQSVGLNFRDVLNVLGMYPGDPGNPGSDMSGVVVAPRSSADQDLAVGKRVFGLAHGCLGTVVSGVISRMLHTLFHVVTGMF